MWLQRFTNYVLKHRRQALLLTFVITFVPVVGGTISILMATLVTLCKGFKEGVILTIAASLPYFISFLVAGNTENLSISLWMVVGVAITSNILSFIFAMMMRDKMRLGAILQVAALMGVLVVSVIHLVNPAVDNWWANQLQVYAEQAQKVAGVIKSASVNSPENRLEWINTVKHYTTGFIAIMILINAVLQLLVAKWWQAVIYQPGIMRQLLRNIRLSPLAGVLFLLSLVLSYLGNSVVLDIMPILYVLFSVAGLSLIHYFFGLMNTPTTWFWLALLYITLVLAMPISLMVISMLGLFDIWLDLRRRLRRA